jgi:hypothetical protein
MNYIECDVPAGMTLVEWRRTRQAPARPRLRSRARLLLRPRAAQELATGVRT